MSLSKIDFFPPIIAHRGAPLRAPENTLESYVAAHKAGARWIEADIKLTSDGVPVLIHDDTLDRTTSGQGPVADMSWAEMQKLDAGSWFSPSFSGTRVTSLMELVSYVSQTDLRLVLELKPSPGRTQATAMVALIEAAKLWPEDKPPPVISSFDPDALMVAAQLHPDWPRGLLLDHWRSDWMDVALATQATTLALNEGLLTPEHLTALKASPLPIIAYTINDPTRAKELLSLGVTAVYSDDVGGLIKG